MIAETMPQLVTAGGEATATGIWILIAIGVMAFFVMVINQGMGVIKGWRDNFGRKPTIDEDIRHYSATIDKLKSDLAKLPDDQKFAKLAEQLAGFATVKQLAALEVAMDRQIKDVSGNSHKEWHTVRNDIGGRVSLLEVGSIGRGERLAAVEANLDSLSTGVRDLNIKVDHIEDRIGDKIIELIRDGTIRGGARA